MTRDELARAIYRGWSKNKIVIQWEDLDDLRRAQWYAAADEVIALPSPPLIVRGLDTGPTAHEVMTEPDRLRLVERLKRRAG